MSKAPRNTATRDQHRAIVARGHPPCGICDEPIDYALPHTDLMSYQVDHIIPIDKGGPDTLDNKQAAHRHCNRQKSNSIELEPITWATERCWW